MFAQVIISGSTASAFVLKGKQWETLQSDRHEDWRACPAQQVANLTSLTQDWTLLEKPKLDYKGVQEMLLTATTRHDVLHFCLMGLDAEYSDDLRLDALAYCETLLQDKQLGAYLAGILFSTPIPESADFLGAIALVQQGFPILLPLLQQVWQVREQIDVVTQVWLCFVSPALREETIKNQVRQGLIENGYFQRLCLQLAQPYRLNLDRLILDHSKLSRTIPKVNVPVLLQEFHVFLQEAIGLQQYERVQHRVEAEEDDEQTADAPASLEEETLALLADYISKGGRPLTRKPLKLAEIQAKVGSDIQNIENAVYSGNLALARKLFFYLLQYQTAYSYKENLLKTCTNLLNLARRAANFEIMETVMLAASALDTTDVVFISSKAEVLKSQGRLQDALQAYDSVISAHPQDAVAQNGRAEVLKAQGRLHDALQAYDAVIRAHPQNVIAQTGRAEVLKAQGRFNDALQAYDALISAHPQNVVAQTGRAEVLKAQGRLIDALQAYDAVISDHPQDVSAQNGRAEVLKAQGRLNDALQAYDAVIIAHPQDVFAQTGRAEVLKTQGRLQDALQAYDTVISAHPQNVVAQTGRVEVLKAQGRLQDALQAYDAVISAHPQNVFAQTGRAEVLKAQGRLHEALQAYDAVISAHPQNAVAQTGRAEVIKAQGRLNDALQAYDAVISVHPQNAVAQTGRAEVLKAQGRLNDALQAYDAVISTHSQDVVAQTGRAEVLKAQGRLQDALQAYDAVISAHPQNVVAQTGRLSMLLMLGELTVKDAKNLLQENPQSESDWIRYHLGCMAMIRDNTYRSAIEKLEWGLKCNPFGSQIPYFISALATAYIGAQEYRKGLQCLEQLTNIDDSSIANARRRILKAHAFFAEHKQADGIQILHTMEASEYPLLRRAKHALEARYVANPSQEHIPALDEEIRIIELQLLVA